MSDPNAALFREVAKFIDAVDQEVTDANERKKDYYADIRGRLAPADFEALKEAIRERRRKRRDPDAYELRNERVWAIISILEADLPQEAREARVAPVSAPANEHPEETAPTRVTREAVAHDPETGELEMPDMPEHLRRAA